MSVITLVLGINPDPPKHKVIPPAPRSLDNQEISNVLISEAHHSVVSTQSQGYSIILTMMPEWGLGYFFAVLPR